ncbi:hypothetical protein A3J19_05425 [Candidatus Daviesbacteria bacterium RIFCSPLOWO2_02_FULL_41_8]|uniref:Polysaccharide biosynthesis protein C-terminal domain-containing protein n=3 Tax=Candidatus Daviesiibacteriota TaxID=1752718 RepID=A0A1F5NIL7_9BACT|nr:MAG: hypothetical protein A2871_03680 [Candidatus Daviesbacteria bacterium RIFCSPHIGHO2_01_FULL_41_23]OGE32499.1 MAG: hypothetical protein A3D83_02525 [Candidatus Daviesbacteria bacterium RIFCSPHIGHO2_02_FULL_41_10]OGE62020.1 MAG: hypothetical protein A2967_03495 [Candidatus Daviesbacteria bacterium RIFCSPLOWO2_01_FULL_41_32]OGE77352.1 MAG: hypothetical protein A3J19_05425 [Candidatus Daviesbacteria bacterium RIFCSPLOWO2_02_FULL_41_8]
MFKSVLSTATFKQSQITILGTIINGILGGAFYILMARYLGPSDFGLLIVSITTLTLIADIVDFGTNTGLVRHVSSSLKLDKEKSFKFLKLAIEFKLAVWILVLLIGFFLTPLIAKNIFNKEALITPLRLVMVGVGGALFFSFASSALQALQRYFIWSVVNIAVNLLRLFFIFILFASGGMNLFSGLALYIVMPFLGFSTALLFLPVKRILFIKNELSVAKQFFHYNFWVAVFTIIAAISARLDTFLSARLLTGFELGLYGAATQLVAVIPQLNSALGVVVAPKFASFQNDNQMITYLKKIQLLVSGFVCSGLLLIPLAVYLIPIIFGQQYTQAIIPFIILFIAMLIFLFSLPIHASIIYYFAKPKVFVWVSIGHLLIIGSLGYFLIANYGITGAAVSVLIGMVFNFLLPLTWLLLKIWKKR